VSEDKRKVISDLISKLKQERDELALQMHLGKEELKDEWDAVQHKLDQLTYRFEPLNKAVAETSEDVWESLKLVGGEIKEGFQRIRKSL
jgi:polyhydroxyalkanoate synthesis regulator phasin